MRSGFKKLVRRSCIVLVLTALSLGIAYSGLWLVHSIEVVRVSHSPVELPPHAMKRSSQPRFTPKHVNRLATSIIPPTPIAKAPHVANATFVRPVSAKATIVTPQQDANNRAANAFGPNKSANKSFSGLKSQFPKRPTKMPAPTFGQQNPSTAPIQPAKSNPFSPPTQSKTNLLRMVKDDDEREKVAIELKDPIWQSRQAKETLNNCDKRSLKVEIRFLKVAKSIANKYLADAAELPDSVSPNAKLTKQSMNIDAFEQIVKEAKDADGFFATDWVTGSLFETDLHAANISAVKNIPLPTKAQAISFVSSESIKVQNTNYFEGARFSTTISEINEDSVTVYGSLELKTIPKSQKRKLPLINAGESVVVDVPQFDNFKVGQDWELENNTIELVRATSEESESIDYLVAIKSEIVERLVSEDEGLTLAFLKKTKEDLSTGIVSPNDLLARPPSAMVPVGEPVNLKMEFGQQKPEQSVKTVLGLPNDSSLSIEGNVESQQISATAVQVRGSNFVLKNGKKGSFSASADKGSISFSRDQHLEQTLQLNMQSNAKLNFAGIKIKANSIDCNPQRIDATGQVRIEIPEIASVVHADRVYFDLKSLHLEYFGHVSVDRKAAAEALPFVVKSEQLSWSLITGEMRTNIPQRPATANSGNRFSNRPSLSTFQSESRDRAFPIRQSNGFGPPVRVQPSFNQTAPSRFNGR